MSEPRQVPESGAADPTLLAFAQAALAISRELSLPHVLQQIVDSARDLASARYSALGVFNREGTLSQFIFSGLTPAESRMIGVCPTGLGLLRAIVDEGHTIRLPRITDDPRSVGFPSGHPPMMSFLGVPIVAAGEVLGNLYLTDKIGAAEFSTADTAKIEILAANAAIAVRNARLFHAAVERGQELALRNKELAALNDLARSTNVHLGLPELLDAVLEGVLAVTNADAGVVYVREGARADMVLSSHRGSAPEAFHRQPRLPHGKGFAGKVAASGEPIPVEDLAAEKALDQPELLAAGLRSLLYIPLRARAEVVGVLGIACHLARRFSEREVALLEAIGQQVGIAVENARLTQAVGELAIRHERTRIGMDLHDGVIQSIYAVGLNLESVRHLMAEDREQAAALLDRSGASLNDAIRDIRSFILDLRPSRFEGDLAQGLARLVREFQANTLTRADLQASPKDISELPEPIPLAIFLSAQEALANIARHARASHVVVRWESTPAAPPTPSKVTLIIEDDGVGFDRGIQEANTHHGLANMANRAEELGGQFVVQSSPGHGTTLRITFPIPPR
ncbi:MAG: GAF domain-containing sensor histidine kinase [Anaerolineales bacterium]